MNSNSTPMATSYQGTCVHDREYEMQYQIKIGFSLILMILNSTYYHRNIAITAEDKAEIKEDDECFSYVQDHHDLKAAATFFSLTNCDL